MKIITLEDLYTTLDWYLEHNPGVIEEQDCELVLKAIHFDDCFLQAYLSIVHISIIRFRTNFNKDTVMVDLLSSNNFQELNYCSCIYSKNAKLLFRVLNGSSVYFFDKNIIPILNKIKFERRNLISDMFSEITEIENNYETLIKTILNIDKNE